MASERWQQVEAVYQAALERDAAERDQFLAERCGDDRALREEVASLLRHGAATDAFFDAPAVELALLGEEPSPIGTRLGSYRITELLGAGGMGRVYRAHDDRLGRFVAIKILDDRFSARFEREARAVAALNHPNVCTLYDIGPNYLVMELVEGDSLATRLVHGPQERHLVVRYGMQIADALAAAHAKGIVHRDLKPENVLIAGDHLKLVDFGLALMRAAEDAPDDGSAFRSNVTLPGTVLGTLAYMSPEQVRGESTDARSDLFSLGALLHEAATGTRVFARSSAAETMAAILKEEPPAVESDPELDRIIRRCLEKDAGQRVQTATEVGATLRALDATRDSATRAPVASTPNQRFQPVPGATPSDAQLATMLVARHRVKIGIAAAAVVLLALTVYVAMRPRSQPTPVVPGAQAVSFTRLTTQAGVESLPSMSPDGKWLVYQSAASGNDDIYLQSVSGENAINLTRDFSGGDGAPAFSPDGESIAFWSERNGGGLYVMGRTGEFVRRVSDNRWAFNPSWSPDGKELVFATEGILWSPYGRGPLSELWVVTIDTGASRRVSTRDAVQPSWSPHGQRIAYWGRRAPGSAQRDIFTIPSTGGPAVPVTDDPAIDWNPLWSPDGRYLYFSSDRGGSLNLWRVPINEASGEVLGPPEAVTAPSPFVADLTFSSDGRRLAYVSMDVTSNLQQVAFDPSTGRTKGVPAWITTGSRMFHGPMAAPEGDALAFYTLFQKQEDLFLSRTDGTDLHQLTNDPARDREPRWSPDGKRLIFFSDRSGVWDLWIVNADGTGLRQLTKRPGVNRGVWSPDGTRIAVFDVNTSDAFVFKPDQPWDSQELVKLPRPPGPMSMFNPHDWSPDGQKLVGFTETGIAVYSLASRSYDEAAPANSPKERPGAGVGQAGRSVWLPDSRRLVSIISGKLYVVDTSSRRADEILSVTPQTISDVGISRDGRRLWFTRGSTEGDIWMATLK